jgi:hypothetical protein
MTVRRQDADTVRTLCGMARTSWKQVRLEEALYREVAIVAASDGRSITNWIERTLKPIVREALEGAAVEEVPGNGSEPVRERANPVRSQRPAPPRSSRKPKPSRWMGCAKHPKARGVSGKGDKMMCGEPGCPNLARLVQP